MFDTSSPTAPALIANVSAGAQPTGVAFGVLAPESVYVSNQAGDYVTVLDIARDKSQMVQGVIDLGTSSSGIAVSNGGTRLYVAEFKNNANLRIYDLTNLGPLSAAPLFEIPGEPFAKTSLAALGNCATDFYIAEATLAPGAAEGYWGMEVALSQEPRELTGGFNLGGGFDGGGRNPGFGAFYVPRPERVTFTINAQPLAGPIALDVRTRQERPCHRRRVGDARSRRASYLRGRPDRRLSRGDDQLVADVGARHVPARARDAGIVCRRRHRRGLHHARRRRQQPSGFGAFCVPRTQQVTVKLFGRTEYPQRTAPATSCCDS